MALRNFKTISWILILLTITTVFLKREGDQSDTPHTSEKNRAALTLPLVSNEVALNKAKTLQEQGVYRFAESIPVQITPQNHGTWETLPSGSSRWTLEVRSPGASSLNFGFSRYAMPEGGSLTIQKPGADPEFRSFTSADNEAHGQLWTPILRSESALISLELAQGTRESLVLELASVNHGFRHEKIGGDISGTCNIDVNCDDNTLPGIGSMIDIYRNQIRSVGAYTLNGIDTCTGALINNTANDRRPFFLTAAHCEVTAENAASMVVFWNFQNSTCRPPGSLESGQIGNGDLSQFNTGATFRAGNSATDFTLVELNDPIANDINAFYAGWNRTGANPESAIGIHHPAVAEKRISFSFTKTQTTSQSGTTSPGDGRFVRVVSWDQGTTEGGSSGSPLFDLSGNIIGQLFGGFAACGNTSSDWYGRISQSWTGGGTSATRLSDWLDPTNSGVSILNGIGSPQRLAVIGNSDPENENGETAFTISLSEFLGGPPHPTFTIDYTTADGTATAGSDYTATSGTLEFAPGETSATVLIPILGDSTPEENETINLILSNLQPADAVFITSAEATATILNDDFIPPVFTSATNTSATVGVPFSFPVTAKNTPTEFRLLGNPPLGMQIDPASGIITWLPTSVGQISITVSATNPAKSVNSTLTIAIAENPLLVAIDNTNFSIPLSTSSSWTPQSAISFDGTDAIQSPSLGNNDSSTFTIETEGPGALEFYWRVSSEAGFDFLTFTTNGEAITQISGEVDWQRYAIRLGSGTHQLAWTYTKDLSQSEGQDTGWLDAVRFVTTNDEVILFSLPDAQIPSGLPYAQRIDFTPSTASLTSSPLPAWLSISDDGFIFGTPPPPPANDTHTISITASHEGISSSNSFEITTNPSIDFTSELGSTNAVAFYNENDTPWVRATDTAASGNTSIRSGGIDDNESSTINASLRGPSTLSFAWRVDSEANFDILSLRLDGNIISQISGNLPWQTFTLAIPAGRHEIQWLYQKDGSESVGLDRAYLDSVSLSGYGAWIASHPVNGRNDPSYDPDKDARSNFMEYALGTDPATPDIANNLTYNFETLPPTINLTKPTNVDGVRYLLQTSTTLAPESWTEEESEIITDDASSFIASPTETPQRIFLRLGAQPVAE